MSESQAGTALRAVKLLATFMQKGKADCELVLETLKEWLTDSTSGNNPTLQLIAGIIYVAQDKFTDGLRAVRHQNSLEQVALSIQIYLKMHRLDLAEKALKQMQSMEEDNTLTQLAAAWVYVAKGGEKLQEAAYIYQELIDRFEPSAMLLNGLAVCNMHMQNFEEAERLLVDAAGKGSNSDTLLNLIACSNHMGKSSEMVQKNIASLQKLAPKHPWISQYAACAEMFDKTATKFAL